MNAGLRAKIQGVLHFVEGGRNAVLAEPVVDEAKEFVLLPGQHASADLAEAPNLLVAQSKTNHEQTIHVRDVFGNRSIELLLNPIEEFKGNDRDHRPLPAEREALAGACNRPQQAPEAWMSLLCHTA